MLMHGHRILFEARERISHQQFQQLAWQLCQDVAGKKFEEPSMELDAVIADWYDRNAPGEHDHYTQPGDLFRLMNG